MSTFERTPLLSDTDNYDSAKTLNEVDSPTLMSFDSVSPNLSGSGVYRDASKRNWVPDPDSKEEAHRARTLVLCFDGTGDQFDDDNSNVIEFLSCLKKDDQKHQLVYYQAGIGTYTKSSFVTPLSNKVSKTLDEMFAWNLDSHVQSGYEFLMQNYTAGDKIAIFGFSRGAYTARALAGMVQKVGLLPTYNHAQVPFAWAMYIREDKDGLNNSVLFKKTFSVDVAIDFVGVWDTVASVGMTNKELPFVGGNAAIRVFRHAMALDEHRAKFIPNFYQASPNANPLSAKTFGTDSIKDAAISSSAMPLKPPKNGKKAKKMHAHRSESQMWEDAVNSASGQSTDVLEVWFAGCHCDVGGGSVRNGTRNALARIPLRWMIRECFRTETGVIFDKDLLKANIGLDADTLYPVVLQRPSRKPAPIGAKIEQMEAQGLGIASFFSVIGSLLAIPIKFVFGVVTWPFHHFWLLIKFTKAAKWVRKLFARKPAIKAGTDPAAVAESLFLTATSVRTSDFKSEEDEELADALSAEYDQLAARWFWWIIEFLPLRFREQKGKRDDYFVRANMGQGRKIYGDARKSGIKIHRSVKTRLEVLDHSGKNVYQPRAWFKVRDPSSKKKEVGPKSWCVEQPDTRTHWEWVE
ncbi:hypothetical protein DFH11DRAFT_1558243 [Phellopilus nigrolimitatus]|nr:hypothetical protein DFH11DRAFT_1558243 [Phellopilus nigrolimitatus]